MQYDKTAWSKFVKETPEDYKDQARSLAYAVETSNQAYMRTAVKEIISKAQIAQRLAPQEAAILERSAVKKLQEELDALKKENEQLKAKIKRIEALSNMRKPTDLDALYKYYKETKSYRATGEHFNLAGKTVKRYLIEGGYIKE